MPVYALVFNYGEESASHACLTAIPMIDVSPTMTENFSPNILFIPFSFSLVSNRLCRLYSRNGNSYIKIHYNSFKH